ncbi:MAG: fused MFS/spermidine synthase [Planctomycetota bacterium]
MRQGLLLGVACATGAAVMVIELLAVRLMAPWFGQSQLVWTNVIGVVLASLALGQWLGGRWAEAGHGFRPASLLVVAGAFSLALPDAVRLGAPRLLPADLLLEEAFAFVTYGSLLMAMLGLLVPMVAMGAVTPWLVRLSADASQSPGRVTGRVLGAGTFGSLLGTFGATHWLLEAVGSEAAVRGAGALLLLAGLAVALGSAQRAPRALLSVVLPLGLALLPRAPADARLLAAVETPYQFARVVVDDDGTRLLRLNEGLDSFHSALLPGRLWTGRYFDAFVAPALLAPASADGRRDVLIIGLGGGTMARQILAVDDAARVTGVELDAELVALGRQWFELPEAVSVLAGVDGRVALRHLPGPYGAILLDAYAQQIYLPPHLCTREFFDEVRARLLPGGVAALNLSGRAHDDPVVSAVAGTFAASFADVRLARVPGTRNLLLLGWNGAAPTAAEWQARLDRSDVAPAVGWMVDGQLFAGLAGDGCTVLRDGHDAVEALAHRSWRRAP